MEYQEVEVEEKYLGQMFVQLVEFAIDLADELEVPPDLKASAIIYSLHVAAESIELTKHVQQHNAAVQEMEKNKRIREMLGKEVIDAHGMKTKE